MKKLRFTSLLALGLVLAAGPFAQGCATNAQQESPEDQVPRRFEIVSREKIPNTGGIFVTVLRDKITKQEFILTDNKYNYHHTFTAIANRNTQQEKP